MESSHRAGLKHELSTAWRAPVESDSIYATARRDVNGPAAAAPAAPQHHPRAPAAVGRMPRTHSLAAAGPERSLSAAPSDLSDPLQSDTDDRDLSPEGDDDGDDDEWELVSEATDGAGDEPMPEEARYERLAADAGPDGPSSDVWPSSGEEEEEEEEDANTDSDASCCSVTDDSDGDSEGTASSREEQQDPRVEGRGPLSSCYDDSAPWALDTIVKGSRMMQPPRPSAASASASVGSPPLSRGLELLLTVSQSMHRVRAALAAAPPMPKACRPFVLPALAGALWHCELSQDCSDWEDDDEDGEEEDEDGSDDAHELPSAPQLVDLPLISARIFTSQCITLLAFGHRLASLQQAATATSLFASCSCQRHRLLASIYIRHWERRFPALGVASVLQRYGPSMPAAALGELLETLLSAALPHLATFPHALRHDVLVVYGRHLCYRDLLAILAAVYPRYVADGAAYNRQLLSMAGHLLPPATLLSQHPSATTCLQLELAVHGGSVGQQQAADALVQGRALASRRLFFFSREAVMKSPMV